MSEKHSPGPWTLIDDRPFDVRGADGELVVANCGCGPPDNVADVRLIAAAPELLDALRDLVADIADENGCVCCDSSFGEGAGLIPDHRDDCRAKAALALLKRIDGELSRD